MGLVAAVYEALSWDAEARHLRILGGFHPGPEHGAPEGCHTLLMIGPAEPAFWPAFQATPEYQDGAPDPLDRWSKRVLGDWAAELGAEALFPSDGPPYAPFIAWAKATRRVHNSPAGILVHDLAGLMVSFRGALALRENVDLPNPPPSPCLNCADRPCLIACPVGALAEGQAYDVPKCKDWLDRDETRDCMTRGCAVRRACPVSQSYGRPEAQSAFHMRSFHPT
ncbi:ferredoxin [Primorskyibacter aestuariivivens]|uniref:ferredoxin n=1 Tax=Primorskyibacter aestuariivivens TaxID=1888912 RepID=UPI002301352B|nr:ferredoxin [Primorskyibacter aestuariivivens]MDA7430414.1 ferredoxin [Primorskyibacter aestuariivivens]